MSTPTDYCKWCNRVEIDGEWVDGPTPEGLVSHGICPDCYRKVLGEEPEGEDK